MRPGEQQNTVLHGRVAGVGVGAREREHAGAIFGESACAGPDDAGDGGIPFPTDREAKT